MTLIVYLCNCCPLLLGHITNAVQLSCRTSLCGELASSQCCLKTIQEYAQDIESTGSDNYQTLTTAIGFCDIGLVSCMLAKRIISANGT